MQAMPSSDTQYKPLPDSLAPKPICCKFSKEVDAWLRERPDRSEFIRAAVDAARAAALAP